MATQFKAKSTILIIALFWIQEPFNLRKKKLGF